MSRLPVLLALLLGPAAAVGQEDFAAADAAVQARAVLERHCFGCHGDTPNRSPVKVLDHKDLTAPRGPGRPIPFFGRKPADLSLALDLIREGSMPPGSLSKVPEADVKLLENWVATGAGLYPERFDEEFAYKAILADVERLPARDRATARYLSLHHIAAAAPADLAAARSEFLAGIKGLFQDGATGYRVDETATIFRIDLVKAGWHHTPFVRLEAVEGKTGKAKDKAPEKVEYREVPVSANLFDLVLLEYPYAVVPRASQAFDRLALQFLAVAKQVRPVPYVRGDWFVAAALEPALAGDLEALFRKGGGKPPPALAAKEKARPPSVRRVPPADGVPLPALDAWYAYDGQDPPDPGTVKGVSVSVTRQERKDPAKAFPADPKTTFREDDTFTLKITAHPSSHAQFVYIDALGKVDNRSVVQLVPASGSIEPKETLPRSGFAAPPKPVVTERIRVYAAAHRFAPGEKWQDRAENSAVERFVHPFFALDEKTGKVDLRDAGVVRKSTTIEVVK
jgi:hypothetical protein